MNLQLQAHSLSIIYTNPFSSIKVRSVLRFKSQTSGHGNYAPLTESSSHLKIHVLWGQTRSAIVGHIFSHRGWCYSKLQIVFAGWNSGILLSSLSSILDLICIERNHLCHSLTATWILARGAITESNLAVCPRAVGILMFNEVIHVTQVFTMKGIVYT